MNNYSHLQKFLHWLCLSNRLILEISFIVEKALYLNGKFTSPGKHLFISGMARSGTTTLLNTLFESGEFASLTYADMPFILSPNIWGQINFINDLSTEEATERAHGDGIKISKKSPEAFEEVFWMMVRGDDQVEEFLNFIHLVCKKNLKNRYISKNNQNIHRINLIMDNFPDCFFIVPFRSPLQHAFSLFRQHKLFCDRNAEDPFIGNYMRWIGHREFGPAYQPAVKEELEFPDPFTLNHWLEQWFRCYTWLLQTVQNLNQSNCKLLCYEDLGSNSQWMSELFQWLEVNAHPSDGYRIREAVVDEVYDPDLLNRCQVLNAEMRESPVCFGN